MRDRGQTGCFAWHLRLQMRVAPVVRGRDKWDAFAFAFAFEITRRKTNLTERARNQARPHESSGLDSNDLGMAKPAGRAMHNLWTPRIESQASR